MISVILTGYGGPESLDDVEPFMESIARGRSFSSQQIENAKKRYELIGGKSPLNKITAQQASALELQLNSERENYSVDFGMLHLKPYIADVIKSKLDMGMDKLAIVSLAPFHSRVSTGSYFQEAKEALNNLEIEVVYISKWNSNANYIKSICDGINSSINEYFQGEGGSVNVIFTVHSLPVSFIEQGDPYIDEVQETIDLVLPGIKLKKWHLAYQSKGRGGDWLKPDVETIFESLSKKEETKVLIVPLGFVSEHVETLYDIDIMYNEKAAELGIDLKRVPALNDSSLFIKALAEEVMNNTGHWI